MKKAFLLLLASATAASAQFRNSAGTPFPYKQSLAPTDVFVVGTPGVSNYNFTWLSLTNSVLKTALVGVQTNIIIVPPATGNSSIDYSNLQYCVDLVTNDGTRFGGKSEVYIPPGQYTINGTILLKASGIIIRGAGVGRTRIYQLSTTADTFSGYDPYSFGDSGTNGFWYVTFRNFEVYKVTDTNSRTAAFSFITAQYDKQRLSRAFFENLKISGFYYGIRIEHAVGVLCLNIQAYGNNHTFWLEKVDSATFINCFAGDALLATAYGNSFGDTNSTAWTYKPNSYAEGFNLKIINGESRRVNTVVDAQGGNISIEGMDIELMPNGPVFKFSSGVKSADIRGCRVQRISTNSSPIVQLASGVGQRTRVHAIDRGPDQSSAPVISLSSTTDYVTYSGPPILITNTANSTNWITTQPIEAVAAGNGVSIVTNGDLVTINADVANIPAFRENGTNVLYFYPWMLLNNDNTVQGTTPYQYGAYRNWTYPHLRANWSGIASVYHTNVSFTIPRTLVFPPIRPFLSQTNFRITGYWCATNATTFRPVGSVSAMRDDGTVSNAQNTYTNWDYTSTITNVMAHTVTLTIPPGTNLWVQGAYGVASGANGGQLDTPVWLLLIKVEYW
jgi:hypothetical protein